jgi:hypothetical protein
LSLKGKSYYTTFKTPSDFLNSSKYNVSNLDVLDTSCRTRQATVYSYKINCSTEIKLSFAKEKAVVEASVKIFNSFSSKEELIKVSEKILSTDLFKSFSSSDPLAGLRKKYPSFIQQVIKRSISEGMPEELLYLSWGEPGSKNVYNSGRRKQLIYGRKYLYIENGVISSWQSFSN